MPSESRDRTAHTEGAFAVRIVRAPDGAARRGRAAMELARALSISLADARILLDRAPSTTPRRMTEDDARALARLLAVGDGQATPVALGSERGPCATHPGLDADEHCASCQALVCSVCRAFAGEPLCGACLKKRRRQRAFTQVRVSVLLGILAIVLLYAWNDVHRRRERTDWTRTLNVALVLLERGAVDPVAIQTLKARSSVLAARLNTEMHRYRKGPPPFDFTVVGPVRIATAPPDASGNGFIALAEHQYELWRYLRHVDARAGVDPDAYDSRIYLVIHKPRSRIEMVEGFSEEGGRIGVVSVDLGRDMADFALFVATHELMHTLGATDKYSPSSGLALVPQGLGNPEQVPLYPQRTAEVMARNLVISPGHEKPPTRLSELSIGRWTAREIGWLR